MQVAAEERFGAMKAYARGTFITVQNDGDLGKRSIARVAQGDDFGIGRR
jgi:hypothetical protein